LVPLLGLSVFGWLPILAGAAMALSSVTVVGNSILLGRYRPQYTVVKPKEGQVYSERELKSVYTPTNSNKAGG
jgi:P-type Cu+ transporter